MARPQYALAFAGPGESTLDNTTALINDLIGVTDDADFDNRDLALLFPLTRHHLSKGLKTVLEWTDEYQLAYDAVTDGSTKTGLADAEEVIEADDVNAALIGNLVALRDDGYTTYLVLLWGEEGDDNAEELLDLANHNGIKALDLTAGLDDIAFEEDQPAEEATPEPAPEPEPAPDPEPAPEKPRRRQALKVEEKPLEEKPEPEPTPEPEPETVTIATPEESRGMVMAFAEAAAVPVDDRDPALHDMFLRLAGLALEIAAVYKPGCITVAEEEPPAEEEPEKAPVAPQEPAEAPKRGRGRPRKDGTPAQPRSALEKAHTEIWDEIDKEWQRAGRGRIPKGIRYRKVDPRTGEIVEEAIA